MLRRTSFSTSSPEQDWLSSRMRKVEPNGTVSASVTSLLKEHAEHGEQEDEGHRPLSATPKTRSTLVRKQTG